MWAKSRVGNLLSWVRTRLASSLLLRSRKASILILGGVLLFLIWSALKLYPYHYRRQAKPSDRRGSYSGLPFDEVCLANHLAKWDHELDHADVIISHNPLHSHESPYIPFVAHGASLLPFMIYCIPASKAKNLPALLPMALSGKLFHSSIALGNGNLGIAARKDSFLQLKETTLMEVPYKPLLEPSVKNGPSPKEATVINIRDGVVHHVQSYLWSGSCIILESLVYTHRSHSSLLVQHIKVTNHAAISAEISFKEIETKGWAQSATKHGSLTLKSKQVQYDIHQGNIAYLDKTHPGVNVTIVTSQAPKALPVNGRSSMEHHHMAAVHSSINLSKSPHNVVEMNVLEEQAKKDLQQVLDMDYERLYSTHKMTWNELWKTGIHVNPRHDPDTPPGNEVNATMYYLLSTFPSPDYDVNGKAKDMDELESLLHAPEHCFGGPPTMHSASLWPIPRTEAAVSRMMLSWKQVLKQNGCSSLIKAGATGIAQAMTLSFGGLQFSAGLFEFAANPASLHTSVTFRHIHLYKDVYINVSVIINEHTGHAEKLLITANLGDGKRLYACEAGCQYEPVELGMSQIVFPVHMTKPVTPILYISKSKSQLQNIKKNVFIKDAHQESLRHHHVFHHVGLPAKFWVTIVFLIVAFHLYLVKIIYYECFKEPVRSKIYTS